MSKQAWGRRTAWFSAGVTEQRQHILSYWTRQYYSIICLGPVENTKTQNRDLKATMNVIIHYHVSVMSDPLTVVIMSQS